MNLSQIENKIKVKQAELKKLNEKQEQVKNQLELWHDRKLELLKSKLAELEGGNNNEN